MIQNVPGLLDPRFDDYRTHILGRLVQLGNIGAFKLFNAAEFGFSQTHWRTVLVAMKPGYWIHFAWPEPTRRKPKTIGNLLFDLMGANGWQQVDSWKSRANGIAPTIVGGSKKHRDQILAQPALENHGQSLVLTALASRMSHQKVIS